MRRLLLVAVAVCVALPARAAAQPSLPPGAGRALLAEACAQCHELRPIVTQRKAETAWRRTVAEMIWRGAPLLPGEADVLVAYLAASFPPSGASGDAPPEPDPGSRRLPPGPARPLVLRACVGCHDLQTTLMRRKTVDQWRRSVDLMVRLGTRLDAAESQAVADYLAGFLGPEARDPGEGRP